MIPPLAIVQARMNSTRLPRKMLLPLAGKPLIWHAWNAAVQAFGAENVVIAIPDNRENDALNNACAEMQWDHDWSNLRQTRYPEGRGAKIFRWDGPEDDVLGRFYHCAHHYRWHPDSVIVRVTPDDPRKDPAMLMRVAAGERLPVELGGEAFTLAMLDEAYRSFNERTHITHALFQTPPPPPPPGIWTVDTQEDYEEIKEVMEG